VWSPSTSKTANNESNLRVLATTERILVDARTAALALSISKRAFHSLRKRPDFPQDATVVLGPRCVRFRTEAIRAFALSLVCPPRGEPAQLQGSRKIHFGSRIAAEATGAEGTKARTQMKRGPD